MPDDVTLFSTSEEEEEAEEDNDGDPSEEEWARRMEFYMSATFEGSGKRYSYDAAGLCLASVFQHVLEADAPITSGGASVHSHSSYAFPPPLSSIQADVNHITVRPDRSCGKRDFFESNVRLLPPLLPFFYDQTSGQEARQQQCRQNQLVIQQLSSAKSPSHQGKKSKLSDTQVTIMASLGGGGGGSQSLLEGRGGRHDGRRSVYACEGEKEAPNATRVCTARSAKELAYRGRGRKKFGAPQGSGRSARQQDPVGHTSASVSPGVTVGELLKKRGSGLRYEGSSGISRNGRFRKKTCRWVPESDPESEVPDACIAYHSNIEGEELMQESSKTENGEKLTLDVDSLTLGAVQPNAEEAAAGSGYCQGAQGNAQENNVRKARWKPALDMLLFQVYLLLNTPLH